MNNEPEILNNILDEEPDYFGIDRFSNSALSNFKRSPRHYLYFKEHKKDPTPAMIFGSAFHCFVLEPDRFDEQYCCVPPDAPDKPASAMINAAKPSAASIIRVEWWRNFREQNGDKIELKNDDLEKIKRMSSSLSNHEPAKDLLLNIGEVEMPLLWQDDITGIEMKGKLDGIGDGFTIDLKTCINAHPESFSIDAFNNAYHRQAALYLDGRGLNKMTKGDFYFIAIEKTEPFGISVMKCAQDFIKHGRMVYGSLLEDVAYWRNMGSPNVSYEWKSPVDGRFDLNLPAWVR